MAFTRVATANTAALRRVGPDIFKWETPLFPRIALQSRTKGHVILDVQVDRFGRQDDSNYQ
jgi:hypothetical protein